MLYSEYMNRINNQKGELSQLFYQSGNLEFNKHVFTKAELSGHIVIFRLPAGNTSSRLRIDLLNDYLVFKMKSVRYFDDGTEKYLNPRIISNASEVENTTYYFSSRNPQIFFDFEEIIKIDKVEIDADYIETGADALLLLQQVKQKKVEQMQTQVSSLNEAISRYEENIIRLNEENIRQYALHLETLKELARLKASKILNVGIKLHDKFSSGAPFRFLQKVTLKVQLPFQVKKITKSGVFDRQYYLSQNPDVMESGISPEIHYLKFGWKEGRNPSPDFITAVYLSKYPELLAIGKNPIIHYLENEKSDRLPVQSVVLNNKKTPVNNGDFPGIFKFLIHDKKKIATPKHFSPPVDDYALQIPFNWEIPDIKPQPSIAVFCHIFHDDLIGEIKTSIQNIPFPFDLYITTNTEEKKDRILNEFTGWKRGSLEIKIFENRGRDIAPKLLAWKAVYEKYEFFLHIHSKKAPQRHILRNWRTYLYKNLLGSEMIVRSIFEAFYNDPALGMVGTFHFLDIRPSIGWGSDFDIAKKIAHQAGIDVYLNGRIDYPSGSMFWGRTAAVRPILNVISDVSQFEEELNQKDGTLAHAIERLYFFSCEKAGFKWIKVFDPATALIHQRTLTVTDRNSLPNYINQAQVTLLTETSQQENLNKPVGAERLYFLKIHSQSPYRTWPFDKFYNQLKQHIAKMNSEIDFDEDFYLNVNLDVKHFINIGAVECGFIHYCLNGKSENRIWSNNRLTGKFKLQPHYPVGRFKPVNIQKKHDYKVQQLLLPDSPGPFLLILTGELQKDLFFAGYKTFFDDFITVFQKFEKIVVAVNQQHFEPELITHYSDRIEVIHQSQLPDLKNTPDVIISYNHHETLKAFSLFGKPERVVYYCQEYESGFYPYGTNFIEAERALVKTHNLIISTVLFKNFLEDKRLIMAKNVFITSPVIEALDVLPGKSKKLFFYFRPENFHSRNIPEIIWEAVNEFCNRHTGYELYLAGTIETRFSFEINNNEVYVLSKLSKEDYFNLLKSCDLAVAFIWSAHPGVIAFQAAASGIPTITNIFDNRNANVLQRISDNILPFDPVSENLCAKIEEALGMEKGIKNFNKDVYSGTTQNCSLTEFILKIAGRETH